MLKHTHPGEGGMELGEEITILPFLFDPPK